MTRATRPTFPTAGVGGFIETIWRAVGDTPGPGNLHRTEVGLWSLQFRHRNVELPESGGYGAMGVYRVAESFRFTAELDMKFKHEQPGQGNVQATKDAVIGNPDQPFIEEYFRGFGQSGPTGSVPDFHRVELRLQIGDPDRAPDGIGSFYYCPGVMVEDIIPTNPSRPPFDVARATVKGVGAEPMQRWVGETMISGNVFDF